MACRLLRRIRRPLPLSLAVERTIISRNGRVKQIFYGNFINVMLSKYFGSNQHESRIAFLRRRMRLQRRFRRRVGFRGNFEAPREYTEKVQFRKLYGNHATYAQVADKYAVREFVAERAGEQYLVPLYAVCDRLTPDAVAGLPNSFVAKATHGCKWNRIVHNKDQLDAAELIEFLNDTMTWRFGEHTGELHYSLIPPRIVVEKLLQDRNGNLPYDYYIFCYNTPAGFDYSVSISSPGITRAAHYDRHWNRWDGTFSEEEHERFANPANFPEMLEVARRLSAGFDFVRVDLYSLEGRIYFGEMTVTPNAGFGVIEHPERAAHRSDSWKIDGDNPQLYTRSPG